MNDSEAGYINRNGQVNVQHVARLRGRQRVYQLHCLYCGHTYKSVRVYDRRCPGCQLGSASLNLNPLAWPTDHRAQRKLAIKAIRQALRLDRR